MCDKSLFISLWENTKRLHTIHLFSVLENLYNVKFKRGQIYTMLSILLTNIVYALNFIKSN